MIELDPQTGGSTGKVWQHSSWSQYGWMGAIASDDKGNTFVAPAPVVSVLDNPVEKQNTIYRVASATGDMKPFKSLPRSDTLDTANPYGLLGLFFDCNASMLYASSVAGSSAHREAGVVYAIDPSDGKIIDEWKDIDVIGICVSGTSGEKRLYAGHARNGSIVSIGISPTGSFTGPPRTEFSLDMLGQRGDDKARRLRIDQNGDMLVWGIAFNYNLTAATEKLETMYRFRYDQIKESWAFVGYK